MSDWITIPGDGQDESGFSPESLVCDAKPRRWRWLRNSDQEVGEGVARYSGASQINKMLISFWKEDECCRDTLTEVPVMRITE